MTRSIFKFWHVVYEKYDHYLKKKIKYTIFCGKYETNYATCLKNAAISLLPKYVSSLGWRSG
jgi:hypothetical protein